MATDRTLLAHLYPSLHGQAEDIAVKSLEHLLKNYQATSEGLCDVLREGGADIGPLADFRSHTGTVESGIPDLTCVDSDHRPRLLIEAKFNADLTEKQPIGYFSRLSDEGKSALLFVVPCRRLANLWSEILSRVSSVKDFQITLQADQPTIKSVTVCSGRSLIITSWQFLLARVVSRVVEAKDENAIGDVRQLQGLIDAEDGYSPRPLTTFDWHNLGSLEECDRLIREVAGRLQHANVGMARNRHQFTSTGSYHVQYLGKTPVGYSAWFGVDAVLWRKYGSPLWFGFQSYGRENIGSIRPKLWPILEGRPNDYRMDGSPEYADVVRLNIPLQEEFGNQVAEILSQLKYIAQLLARDE